MTPEKTELLNTAFDMYNKLLNKIEDLYKRSEGYMIPKKLELNDILYDAESYMKEVFNCIANANGVISEDEKAFIDKLTVYKKKKEAVTADTLIKATFDDIPEYIKLADTVDAFADTNYAKELVNDTLALCKELMDIDDNTYADESSFTYSFVDMLEKYIKEN